MATVELIDGRRFENVTLTDVTQAEEDGRQTATAHIGDATYSVETWGGLWSEYEAEPHTPVFDDEDL
ncbi:hypothetical protein [Ktedonospora formicarum]|uniref:Uncharacterized protein n=1 Tax=Ktedonospora formicarum TaxID=2778364 RepID=A0A8J3I9I0_9CHLR|nr:hypothetical protein [Ktedonospora formicarum]GHO49688.1 hypothetical protein KSX_78510 [Ktedonospora formicarum]